MMKFYDIASFMEMERKHYEETGDSTPFGEVFDPNDEVERAGYRTTEQIVQEMMIAGQNLRDYRAELYSFPDGVDDGGMALPRDLDLVDRDKLIDAIKERSEKKVASDKAKAEAEAKTAANKAAEDAKVEFEKAVEAKAKELLK